MFMTHLGKFRRLAWPEKWLLMQACGLLAFIVVALRLCSLATLQRLLFRLTDRSYAAFPARRPPVVRIVWAIQAASCWLPLATCLPQALAAHFMLTRYGYPAALQLGAARTADGQVAAHAWVTSQNEIVIGRLSDLDRFMSLTPAERNA